MKKSLIEMLFDKDVNDEYDKFRDAIDFGLKENNVYNKKNESLLEFWILKVFTDYYNYSKNFENLKLSNDDTTLMLASAILASIGKNKLKFKKEQFSKVAISSALKFCENSYLEYSSKKVDYETALSNYVEQWMSLKLQLMDRLSNRRNDFEDCLTYFNILKSINAMVLNNLNENNIDGMNKDEVKIIKRKRTTRHVRL